MHKGGALGCNKLNVPDVGCFCLQGSARRLTLLILQRFLPPSMSVTQSSRPCRSFFSYRDAICASVILWGGRHAARFVLAIHEAWGAHSSLFRRRVRRSATSLSFFLKKNLLDSVRAGLFDVFLLVPASSTWPRASRCAPEGQTPLRGEIAASRALDGFSPSASAAIQAANRHCECTVRRTGVLAAFVLFFPKDFGGHPTTGPT